MSRSAEAKRDTIFALASGPGRAGVAVVRISGPNACDALALTEGDTEERKASFRRLYDRTNGDRIDDAIVLLFRGPHSYTGENVVEFQLHGSRAVLAALFEALAALPGFRPAEPGEFTRRAVENGRLDLSRAEAIADLVSAETDAQRRLALEQYDGRLSHLCEAWRGRLIRASAWIEAVIDFSEEEIPKDATKQSRSEITELLTEIRMHLDDGNRGEILREGFHVAVIGPPNAGKSSLVNALAQRDVAIVAEQPGTTRDIIEVRLDLSGFPIVLCDTAGLRESTDKIEQEGVRRARARAEAADLRLLVLDGTEPGSSMPGIEADLVVWNKADIAISRSRAGLWISAKTGEGVADLITAIGKEAAERLTGNEAPVVTRARHRHALEEAASGLSQALAAVDPELAAEHLRLALRAIGRITGRVDLDELLDVVFRDFCIGK